MGRSGWYRSVDWSDEIRAEFFGRLKRARNWNKGQYLRIQAVNLLAKHPDVSLELLEEYFSLGEQADDSQAYLDQAEAFLALDRVKDAMKSYERALLVERERRVVGTQAYLDLPLLIAVTASAARYDDALALLNSQRDRPVLVPEVFKHHAAVALILSALGESEIARENAERCIAYSQDVAIAFVPKVGIYRSFELWERVRELVVVATPVVQDRSKWIV